MCFMYCITHVPHCPYAPSPLSLSRSIHYYTHMPNHPCALLPMSPLPICLITPVTHLDLCIVMAMCPSPMYSIVHVSISNVPIAHVPHHPCLPCRSSRYWHYSLNTWYCTWPHMFTMYPCYKSFVKMSKRCWVVEKSNICTMEEVHMLMSIFTAHMIVTQNTQIVHRKYFWPNLLTFIYDINIDVNICEPHCFNLFFVNLVHSPDVWHLTTWHLSDILTSFLTFYLNHLSLAPGFFLTMFISVS